jgi:hypothetical protein
VATTPNRLADAEAAEEMKSGVARALSADPGFRDLFRARPSIFQGAGRTVNWRMERWLHHNELCRGSGPDHGSLYPCQSPRSYSRFSGTATIGIDGQER